MNRILKATFFMFVIGGNLIFAMEEKKENGPLQIKIQNLQLGSDFQRLKSIREDRRRVEDSHFKVSICSNYMCLIPNEDLVAVSKTVHSSVTINTGIVSLYSTTNGKEIKEVNKDDSNGMITGMDVSSDGKKLLIGYIGIQAGLYNLETCKRKKTYIYPENVIEPGVALNEIKKEVWLFGNGKIYRYNEATEKPIEEVYLDLYSGLSPDLTLGAVAKRSLTDRHYFSIQESPTYAKKKGTTRFTKKSQWLPTFLFDDQYSCSFDFFTNEKGTTMKFAKSSWWVPTFSNDNKNIAIFDSLDTSVTSVFISNFEKKQISVCIADNQPWVKCPTFSSDGEKIAVGTDGAVNIFETSNGVLEKTLPVDGCPMQIDWKGDTLAVVTSPAVDPANDPGIGIVYIFNNKDLSSPTPCCYCCNVQ